MESPKVSIIIPCRNEEKFISRCLDSILANAYPKEKIEVFIVDGMSKDKTRQIVLPYTKQYPFVHLLDNPKHITPCALNIGIRAANSDIIIRMDGHASYKEDYIVKCVTNLEKYNVDNIGGIWEIIPQENTAIGRGIAKAMTSYIGTGRAYYKIGLKKAKIVDTVPFGCYRKKLFYEVGFFNENLARSQDMEFNIRLKKAGKRIFMLAEIVGYYYVRSTLKSFFIHNFKDGIWAIYPLKFVKVPLRPRHYVPCLFVVVLLLLLFLGLFFKPFMMLFLLTMAAYIIIILSVSVQTSLETNDITYAFTMPIAFAARHFGYGLGSLWGMVRLIL